MSLDSIKGVIPPVITVMNEKGEFDSDGMGAHIDRLLESDVNALLFLGSAGEFSQLTAATRKRVAEFCVKRVAGRKPVIIGTGACGTAEVVELSQHAQSIGADAVIVVNPYYQCMSDDRLYRHYRTISESISIPVLMYNFPALTGQDLSPALVTRIAKDCPNVIGIKDTVDCISHIRDLILQAKGARPDFKVVCGYDEYLFSTLAMGGDGGIIGTSNFAPQITCGIYKAFQEKDMTALTELLPRLGILSQMYALDVPFYWLLKEAARATGSDIPTGVAAPASVPGEDVQKRLAEILAQAGL
ncbi:putative 2-keto-3-deoxy-galactonate aldolase YagE [Pseudodesulfovibrio hydrargyri]|uniref:Putative 2-keto-3-deoxy-galactonate aldolase YagE n=1 Tax=Pseudodesulfovibrio hydrargyri TaxID=2125990 RepID=A0A1J5MVC0_9BACT|nr:dihydrodipicolinate synthase family protein [Pseudodesulfovibrio hydrargyri]OIQ50558.1 putative 2-keto-3-deoxy-galactonate aldolase YagE [Pseudodesulfovibrio hydrargyri]